MTLNEQVKAALVETGRLLPNSRVKIINVEVNGDWGTIEANCYRYRCRRPFKCHILKVFIPSNSVFWSESTFHYL